MAKRTITIDLPFEEGKTYTTKFATGEKFTISKIIYRKKSKEDHPDVIYQFLGIYERSPNLGNCPMQPERLIPHKETKEEEIECCITCGKPIKEIIEDKKKIRTFEENQPA